MKEPLFNPQLAATIAKGGGGLYRPSNGSEGELFQDRWCRFCMKDVNNDCPIIAASMAYSVNEPEYPRELKHDDKGQPMCTAFNAAANKEE